MKKIIFIFILFLINIKIYALTVPVYSDLDIKGNVTATKATVTSLVVSDTFEAIINFDNVIGDTVTKTYVDLLDTVTIIDTTIIDCDTITVNNNLISDTINSSSDLLYINDNVFINGTLESDTLTINGVIFSGADTIDLANVVLDNVENTFTVRQNFTSSIYTNDIDITLTSESARLFGSGSSTQGLLHIRANQNDSGYITFTEDNVAERGAIGFTAGDANLYFVTGGNIISGTKEMYLNSNGLNVSDTVTASYFVGDGSLLTGISTSIPDSYIRNYESDTMIGDLIIDGDLDVDDNLIVGKTILGGSNNSYTGNYSISVGSGHVGNGSGGAVFGASCRNYASYSAAIGLGSKVESTSYAGLAVGEVCEVHGRYGIALGLRNESTSFAEFAIGQYNVDTIPQTLDSWVDTNFVVVIGNGTSNTTRSNLMTITKGGNLWLDGNIEVTDTITANAFSGNGNNITYTDSNCFTIYIDTDLLQDTTYANYFETSDTELGINLSDYNYNVYRNDTVTLSGDTIVYEFNESELSGYMLNRTVFRFYSTLTNYYTGQIFIEFRRKR